MKRRRRGAAGRNGARLPGRFFEIVLFATSLFCLGLVARSSLEAWTFSRWEGSRLEAAMAQVRTGPVHPDPGGAIARLDVPRLGLAEYVIDGASKRELDRGVGRIPGTDNFGGPGTVGLAGHRDRHFRKLKDIQLGDTLRVSTVGDRYMYVVEDIRVVHPGKVDVLASSGYPKLALVTCYPFHYIGPAPRRFVVAARQLLENSGGPRISP